MAIAESLPPGGQLRYREASSADVPAMERCRAADSAAGPADARMSAYLDNLHHPQQALTARVAFVALDDDRIVAYIAGHATTRHGCGGEVQYLYVAPRYRRAGVARRLLERLARWFEEHGIHRVCVNADVDSAGAVPFYSAAGARALNRHWYIWNDIRTMTFDE